jgi:hypothetical protein
MRLSRLDENYSILFPHRNVLNGLEYFGQVTSDRQSLPESSRWLEFTLRNCRSQLWSYLRQDSCRPSR